MCRVYKNPIDFRKLNDMYYEQSDNPKLQWLLRYESSVPEVINSIDKWNKDINIPFLNEKTERKIFESIWESVESVLKGVLK